jgi:hypothetical protein
MRNACQDNQKRCSRQIEKADLSVRPFLGFVQNPEGALKFLDFAPDQEMINYPETSPAP